MHILACPEPMPSDALEFSPQVIVLVLLALPGLLGHAVFVALTYTVEPTWSARAVIGIILSAAAYALCAVLASTQFARWLPDPNAMLEAVPNGLGSLCSWNTAGTVAVACVFAVFLGGLVAVGHNHRLLHRTANRMGLTTRTGFVSEWDAAMLTRARDRWVYAVLEDGTAFGGWLQSHDIASEERTLVLSSVTQISPAGDSMSWPTDQILVLPSGVPIRYLRLISVQEEHHDQRPKADAPAAGRDTIGKSESEPSSTSLGPVDSDSA